jgi:mannose-6-phosphate isomerase-like protein (cupin superfamily)
MPDTTVTKVNSTYSPHGEQGQTYLASGKHIAMRLWRESPGNKSTSRRDYETAGYVISGHADLEIEGQTVKLEPGDSWVVPKGAEHRYRILDEFTAIEATSPPAHVHGRDL